MFERYREPLPSGGSDAVYSHSFHVYELLTPSTYRARAPFHVLFHKFYATSLYNPQRLFSNELLSTYFSDSRETGHGNNLRSLHWSYFNIIFFTTRNNNNSAFRSHFSISCLLLQRQSLNFSRIYTIFCCWRRSTVNKTRAVIKEGLVTNAEYALYNSQNVDPLRFAISLPYPFHSNDSTKRRTQLSVQRLCEMIVNHNNTQTFQLTTRRVKEKSKSRFPYCFLTDFTKFFLWGNMLSDFGFLTGEASWIHRILKIWCHNKN